MTTRETSLPLLLALRYKGNFALILRFLSCLLEVPSSRLDFLQQDLGPA